MGEFVTWLGLILIATVLFNGLNDIRIAIEKLNKEEKKENE